MKIIHEPTQQEPYIVLDKPCDLATAPLNAFDDCALNQAIKIFPEIKNVIGKKQIEYGLVHRLDTKTAGLVLIATTQEFYDYIQQEQKNNKFIKEYTAHVDKIGDISNFLEGFPEFDQDLKSIKSYFRPYGIKSNQVRPVTLSSGKSALKKCTNKLYETKITLTGEIAKCIISQGYRHQVRCHLSWSGYPVKGDNLYNPKSLGSNEKMFFEATAIEFFDPDTKKIVKYNK